MDVGSGSVRWLVLVYYFMDFLIPIPFFCRGKSLVG